MSFRLISMLLSTYTLSACGYLAKPPFETMPARDAQMSCAELAAEVQNITALRQRAWDELGPSSPFASANSFFNGVIWGALNLSYSDAKNAKTVRAVDERLPHLGQKLEAKACTAKG